MTATHREIGATVARLFEDVRAETKRAIENKLGRASLAMGISTVTDTGETRVSQTPRARRPGRRPVGAAAVVATVALPVLPGRPASVDGRLLARRGEAPGALSSLPAVAAPAAVPAAPTAKPQTNLTATSPDATTRPEEHAPAALDAQVAQAQGAQAKAARPSV